MTVAVCDTAPLVPVIVRGYVLAVFPPVVIVSRDEPEPAMEEGLKLAEKPLEDGKPLTLKLTVPLNPFEGVIVTV